MRLDGRRCSANDMRHVAVGPSTAGESTLSRFTVCFVAVGKLQYSYAVLQLGWVTRMHIISFSADICTGM